MNLSNVRIAECFCSVRFRYTTRSIYTLRLFRVACLALAQHRTSVTQLHAQCIVDRHLVAIKRLVNGVEYT